MLQNRCDNLNDFFWEIFGWPVIDGSEINFAANANTTEFCSVRKSNVLNSFISECIVHHSRTANRIRI